MTQEVLLTNSQEEALLQEYWGGSEEMKELGAHLDIEPYPSYSSLEQQLGNQSLFLQPNMYQEQQQQLDNKTVLQQQLAAAQQQYLQQQEQLPQPQFLLQQQQQQQPPPLPNPILSTEEFAGKFNFQLIVNHKNSSKVWVYSERLQKIFINMEQVLPLQFSWTPPQDSLWVRATMVYKYDQHRSQPVVRCHNHMAPDNNSNRHINDNKVEHVIRCTHTLAQYQKGQNGHLSVLTPLGTPEAGVSTVPMDFMFCCKNSCTSGMNRRPTELVFTLETEHNEILARRKLEIRVCSCPKRDKEKEEAERQKMDGAASTATPAGGSKKRKMAANTQPSAPPPGKRAMADLKVYNLNVNILGRDTYNAVLKYVEDAMLSAGVRTNNLEAYKPFVEEAAKKRI